METEKRLSVCRYRLHRRILRSDHKKARNIFDKEFRKAERKFKIGEIDKLERECEKNPNAFWESVRKLGPSKKENIPWQVLDDEGKEVGDKDLVCKTWIRDFEKLYNPVNPTFETKEEYQFIKEIEENVRFKERNMADPLYEYNNALNGNFTLQEIQTHIQRLKNKKATGIDQIPNEILKLPVIHETLKDLFQLYFDTGIVPKVWTEAIIKPLPKSPENDPKIPLNYRGISLLSCVGKLYTSILNSRLGKFLENNNLISEEQNGFRSKRSCSEHIFSLHSIVQGKISKKEKVYTTFVDFSKAFDGVDRSLLYFKMLEKGIDGKMYNTIKALYRLTTACIDINGFITPTFNTLFGVRQGDSMSPTLFSIYINDLANKLKETNYGIKIGTQRVPILLYADDIALMAEKEEDMQELLNILHIWCQKWKMNLNMTKTKFMVFRNKNQELGDVKFHFGNQEINNCKEYKYLGVYFDEHLKFEKHSEMLSKAGAKALGALIYKYKTLDNMGYQTYSKLFQTNITPILDYGSEIWGNIKSPKIDTVQNRAMKTFLGVNKFAANLAVSGDLGWSPSEVRRKVNMVRFWNRLQNLGDNRLPKTLFEFEYNHSGKWCTAIRKILTEIGLENFYEERSSCDLKCVEKKILDKYKTAWKSALDKKPKLRTYRKIKEHFGPEKFVLLNLTRPERSILSQIRCGSLPLKIETGRYQNLPAEERICELCDLEEVEDEIHFIFRCPLYDEQRKSLMSELTPINWTNEESETLKTLFSLVPRKLAKYCKNIFEFRKQQLFIMP